MLSGELVNFTRTFKLFFIDDFLIFAQAIV